MPADLDHTRQLIKVINTKLLTMETILILANGVWGKKEELASLADKADYIIAVDGGWAKLKRCRLNLQVDSLIGDLDSLDQSKFQVPDNVEIKKYPREKDKTDLELAVDEAIKLNPREITVFGALGNRIDHTLTNILMLEKMARGNIRGKIINDPHRIYAVFPGYSLKFAAKTNDTISLIPITKSVEGISTQGLKYVLKDEPLYRTPTRGISNQAIASSVEIENKRGILLVIHQPQVD